MRKRNAAIIRRIKSWFARPEDTRYDVAEHAHDADVSHSRKLTLEERRAVVACVGNEIEKSRSFGLFVERRHFVREILFFTYILDSLGGLAGMRERYAPEIFQRLVTQSISEYFADECRYYWDRCNAENPPGVRNKFNCHLDSVRNAIFSNIYNTKEW
jgi:hypothetical protein